MNVSDALLAATRNYLNITWPDTAGDEKLRGIIARGMMYLDRVCGSEQDYEQAGPHQGLLYNYCRYERSDALDQFQKDYLHELLSIQLAEGVTVVEEPDTGL